MGIFLLLFSFFPKVNSTLISYWNLLWEFTKILFFQNRNFLVTAFKVFYTLIDYLKSLRLTTSPIRQIKLTSNAAVLEEFIPVLANFSDLAFAGLASSVFSES